MSGQQCAKTGLHILNDFRSGRRIATTNRGPLDPPERLAGSDPADWNRSTPWAPRCTSRTPTRSRLCGGALRLCPDAWRQAPAAEGRRLRGHDLDVYMRSVIAEWGNHVGPGSWPSTGVTAGVSTSSPSAALAGGSGGSFVGEGLGCVAVGDRLAGRGIDQLPASTYSRRWRSTLPADGPGSEVSAGWLQPA